MSARGREQLTGRYPCYAVYETADGRHLTIGAFEGHFWATLCRHFGREDFIEYQWDDGAKREEMFAFFRERFRRQPLAAWNAELEGLDICYGPVNNLEEVFADPQLRHRGMIVDLDGRRTDDHRHADQAFRTPGGVRTSPPTFGVHRYRARRAFSGDIGDLRRRHVI
jgi:crotonobetainyl-CoA:carnitine CoA-transferase CaiB-like acyl-CoA transferase